jgi:hypothetical protein
MKKIMISMLLTAGILMADAFKDELEKSYKEIEKMLPITLDKETIWTKAEVKDKIVEYTFILNKTDIDFTPKIISNIEKDLCNNPTVKLLLSNDYTKKILYKNLKNDLIKEINITKKTCGYEN